MSLPLPVALMAARYGLHGGKPRSLEETAMIFGLTRERVRAIETRVLAADRRRDELGSGEVRQAMIEFSIAAKTRKLPGFRNTLSDGRDEARVDESERVQILSASTWIEVLAPQGAEKPNVLSMKLEQARMVTAEEHEKRVREFEKALVEERERAAKNSQALHESNRRAEKLERELVAAINGRSAEVVFLENERDMLALKLAAARVKATPNPRNEELKQGLREALDLVKKLQGELGLEEERSEHLEEQLAKLQKPKPGIPLKVQFVALVVLAIFVFQVLGAAGLVGWKLHGEEAPVVTPLEPGVTTVSAKDLRPGSVIVGNPAPPFGWLSPRPRVIHSDGMNWTIEDAPVSSETR